MRPEMPVNHPIMIIAGIPEDQVFSHICYVANHLSRMLPNFEFEKISKRHEEWESWLRELCERYKWSHSSSPLVWREIGKRVGTATYIGSATQFWEFIREYYGIESRLSKDELKTLSQDFVQEMRGNVPAYASKQVQQKRQITIFGTNKSLCENLIIELLSIEKLHSTQGMAIKLYNSLICDENIEEQIKDIGGGPSAAKIVQTISGALIDCDLLVILDEILREDKESTDDWLNHNRTATLELASQINDYAPAHLRVIFCSDGPTCFNAGVLASASTKLDTENIVAVGAHQGLNILHEMLSNLVDVPLEEMGCPPVWGFLGVNRFIDISNAVQKHDIFRPNDRALKARQGTTLPLGIRQPELRSFFYLAHDKKPHLSLLEHKVAQVIDFQKCKAICDLLKLWYDESCNADGEIISLGIRSDGTFGIPEGVFFSQPVYLEGSNNESRHWMPCSEFPIPNHPGWILKSMVDTARILVEKYMNFNIPEVVSSTRDKDIPLQGE